MSQKKEIFSKLSTFLQNKSSLVNNWQSIENYYQNMENFNILVVGAGGLGCQIVKNLALSGVRNIHLIDMDTIDLTNLNRQFLFREKDIGKHKAVVVGQFIAKRCPGVKVYPYICKIQQKSIQFYRKFSIIIGGLDNIEARKFLNENVLKMNRDCNQSKHFYIDGATQGFDGQVLLVEPYVTSCYQCTLLGQIGTQNHYNYCTIANTPRIPEHCIQYVNELQWNADRKQQIKDYDNRQHLQWIYKNSLERANKYKIQGVTQMLVLGVVKNIIPAISSTNALIASICTHQVLKLITGCSPKLNNYLFYRGAISVGSDTYLYAKKNNCVPCSLRQNKLEDIELTLNGKETLQDVVNAIHDKYEQVEKVFINYQNQMLLNMGDQQRYDKKINMTFDQWKNTGKFQQQIIILYVSNKKLKDQLRVKIKIQ